MYMQLLETDEAQRYFPSAYEMLLKECYIRNWLTVICPLFHVQYPYEFRGERNNKIGQNSLCNTQAVLDTHLSLSRFFTSKSLQHMRSSSLWPCSCKNWDTFFTSINPKSLDYVSILALWCNKTNFKRDTIAVNTRWCVVKLYNSNAVQFLHIYDGQVECN